MQAISVRQPYAWAIARGYRRLSNQAEPTNYRGTVLVHAAMRVDLDSCSLTLVRETGWDPSDPLATLGAVIAVADLAGVCDDTVGKGFGGHCECGPWSVKGQYHWRLDGIRPLRRPIVALGRQPGLWTPQQSLVTEVEVLLEPPPRESILTL